MHVVHVSHVQLSSNCLRIIDSTGHSSYKDFYCITLQLKIIVTMDDDDDDNNNNNNNNEECPASESESNEEECIFIGIEGTDDT
jgi:hypothetical protein